jgi:hypothetical protein
MYKSSQTLFDASSMELEAITAYPLRLERILLKLHAPTLTRPNLAHLRRAMKRQAYPDPALMLRESEPAPERILPATILTEKLAASQVERNTIPVGCQPKSTLNRLEGEIIS